MANWKVNCLFAIDRFLGCHGGNQGVQPTQKITFAGVVRQPRYLQCNDNQSGPPSHKATEVEILIATEESDQLDRGEFYI